jgi:hypothetical protein
MLWEDQFYEDGVSIAERIAEGVRGVRFAVASNIAIEARTKMKLRHAPLLIACEMAREYSRKFKANEIMEVGDAECIGHTISEVIQRPDELAEFVALYWRDGKCPLSKQVKLGLAKAFTKFDRYQMGKWNQTDRAIKLRDVLFLCHAKPADAFQAETFQMLIDGTLPIPDTWEVALSSGADKRTAWERLLVEKKLGALALLRNLRNMEQAGVDEKLVKAAIASMNTSRVLPFRFISAATHAPKYEPELEVAMFNSVATKPVFKGKTVILVDVSGSMYWSKVSGKSDISFIDAAAAIAMIGRQMCEDCEVFSFSVGIERVPARRGFALRDAIFNQPSSGTSLGYSVQQLNNTVDYDRLIVITDEQSHDRVPDPKAKGYMVNVAANKKGVGYGKWLHVDGFSEAVLDYITAWEG